MPKKSCQNGLDECCRDLNGEIRHKNGSTRINTLRETYGRHFAAGYRGDMKLDTLLDRSAANSLSDYLKRSDWTPILGSGCYSHKRSSTLKLRRLS